MQFAELLQELNIDAGKLLARFSGNEMLAKRFLTKFPTDKTYERLMAAAGELNYDAIRDEAHALKGIGLNLGLDTLGNESSDLCEDMRAGKHDSVSQRIEAISQEYARVIAIIERA